MSPTPQQERVLRRCLAGIEELRPLLGAQLDDARFAEIIHKALGDWGIAEDEFRDEFALSQSTVLRWSSGHNLPQPLVRPVIVEWVCDRLMAEAKKLGAELK